MFRFTTQHTRLMTVIKGIPFYQSTGNNSKQPKTWFPFKGVDPSSGWIIKPKGTRSLEQAGVIDFCLQHEIDKEVSLQRFGDINTMCISASIGGGFWEGEKGKLLLEYLKENYDNLFLSQNEIDSIKSMMQTSAAIQKVSLSDKVNSRIKDGAQVLLADVDSRFPTAAEIDLLMQADKFQRQALLEFITNQRELNEAIVTLVRVLDKKHLLAFAMQHFILEDAEQVNELLAILKNKGDIDKVDLTQFENNHHIKLPEDRTLRRAYRLLRQNDNLIPEYVSVVDTLHERGLLFRHIKLLTHRYNLDLLKSILGQYPHHLELKFINSLRHSQLARYDDLLTLGSTRHVLMRMEKFKVLNQENIDLLNAILIDPYKVVDLNRIEERSAFTQKISELKHELEEQKQAEPQTDAQLVEGNEEDPIIIANYKPRLLEYLTSQLGRSDLDSNKKERLMSLKQLTDNIKETEIASLKGIVMEVRLIVKDHSVKGLKGLLLFNPLRSTVSLKAFELIFDKSGNLKPQAIQIKLTGPK